MIDMTQTVIAKSDQTNADDLIGRTLTIKITKVTLVMGEQPIIINYENDNGKPYKPGKSMRRVLLFVWGADGNQYVGRSLTLYRDEKVSFGGLAVGGIRISHMSHIENAVTLVLTASKANKKPFTVKPLKVTQDASEIDVVPMKAVGIAQAKKGMASLKEWWSNLGAGGHKLLGAAFLAELKIAAAEADAKPKEVPFDDEPASLEDRVNTAVAAIHMDRECFGTDDYQDVTESADFKALWSDVKASGNKELLGKISAAMQPVAD